MEQRRLALALGNALVEAASAIEAEVVGQHMAIQAAAELGTEGAATYATG